MGVRAAWDSFTEYARAQVALPGPALREGGSPALTIEDVIAEAIATRNAAFTLTEAKKLPPVIRARQLLTSLASQLPVLLYRDGVRAEQQPRIVRRPHPSRREFVEQSVAGLVDVGEVFWRLGEYDGDGRPGFVTVLEADEVEVTWDRYRVFRRYTWRGLHLIEDRDIKHIALDRGPVDLHGRGALSEGLEYLAPVAAAEQFASGWFATGGVPSVTLRSKETMTDAQSADVKRKWMAAHAAGVPTPAVLGGGLEDHYPGVDPQRAQLQEARSYGATVVARLLGIPGPLLQIETSGSTITYQNSTAALGELVKGTLAPIYLAPIEQAWSDLVGSRASVRFELNELQRADVAARFAIYEAGIPLGVFTAPEVRAWEGLPAAAPAGPPAALEPAPGPRTLPALMEVPA